MTERQKLIMEFDKKYPALDRVHDWNAWRYDARRLAAKIRKLEQ